MSKLREQLKKGLYNVDIYPARRLLDFILSKETLMLLAGKEREFLMWIFEAVWEGNSLDGGDVQDKAEELGLLVPVKISEDKREEYNACMEYDTDTLYFPYWSEEAQHPNLIKPKLPAEPSS